VLGGGALFSVALLAPPQRHFLHEYLVDLDPKEAAIRAGYTRGHAAEIAARLLRRPDIAAEIEKELSRRREKLQVAADRVLQEYAHIAFADLRHFFDWGPEGVALRPKAALSDGDAAALASIELPASNGRGAKLRLHDKKTALDALARHLGLFDPQNRKKETDFAIDGKDPREVLRERLGRLIGNKKE
jgi:phage terminase small subunit